MNPASNASGRADHKRALLQHLTRRADRIKKGFHAAFRGDLRNMIFATAMTSLVTFISICLPSRPLMQAKGCVNRHPRSEAEFTHLINQMETETLGKRRNAKTVLSDRDCLIH